MATVSIPHDWAPKRLGKLVSWKKGRKPDSVFSSDTSPELKPYLTTDYLRGNECIQFIPPKSHQGLVDVNPEDIILIWDGSNAGEVFTGFRGILASTMARLCLTDELSSGYTYFFLKSKFSELNGQTTGATIPHVNRAVLEDLLLPLPKLKEQFAIASSLFKIQAATETQRKIVGKLKELKAATLAKLFQEGTRGDKLQQTELGKIPRSWELRPLGKCCRITSGGTPARDVSSYWNGTIPWVKTGEINYREITGTQEHITEQGLANSSAKMVKKGAVLLAMYGQGITRGKVAMLGIDAATNQACAVLLPDPTIDATYLYAYFMFAYERVRQLGHGANQKNLSADILKQMLIPVSTDLNEQCEIGNIVKKIGSAQIAAEKRLAHLQLLFSSTMHMLVTGQVRIKLERNANGRN